MNDSEKNGPVEGFDSSGSYSTPTMDDIKQAMKKVAKLKAKMEMSVVAFNLRSKFDPCPTCGHERRIESGTVYVCLHFWQAVKKRLPIEKSPTTIPSPMMGLQIIVEEVG